MAYLAVTLGGVTHVDLLLDKETTLPFVGFKVPLTTFFVAPPLAFVLVHFGLLLQHAVLSRKLRAFEERLWKEHPTRNRREQPILDELHSYSFTQSVSGMPKGAAVDIALRLVMSLSLVVLPLMLLTFFQIGFLPYHSEPVTWWHRGMLLTDVAIIVVLARYLARRDRKTKVRLTDWWYGKTAFRTKLIVWWRRKLTGPWWALSRVSLHVHGQDYGPAFARLVRPIVTALRGTGTFGIRCGAFAFSSNRFVIGLLVLFSICVATLPDEDLDWGIGSITRKWAARLREPLPFCRPTTRTTADGKEKEEWCPPDTLATRHAFYPTAYLFERKVNETTGKSDSLLGWSRNLIVTDKALVVDEDENKTARLSLRGRDLRYATLDRSALKRADFYGAKLGSARLFQTDLNAANFRAASLQGADLTWARMQGADLTGASLQGANLSVASLQGADLTWARMQGANLTLASLQGADLSVASLQGADLTGASLEGANLTVVSLQGANLSVASLQGANLSGAWLQGADLSGASLRGVDLSVARIWGGRAPGEKGAPRRGDEWDLASFSQMDIRPLDDEGRNVLSKTSTELELLQKEMVKKDVSGRERVEQAAKRVAARTSPLLEAKDDEKWKSSDDIRTWCTLAGQRAPDPAKLSTYLGELARDDDTDKAYMAQRLIRRALQVGKPDSFLEAFKGSPAFGRISADLKSQLEQAAQKDRDEAAKRKENPEKIERPAPPNVPKACASLVDKPSSPPANKPLP